MLGKLTITPAETAEERRDYIYFQWEVYKDDPLWVPPLISEREAFLDPEQNPFHDHSRVRHFIARRDGKIVGTIAGIVNDNHIRHWNEKVGFFGLFEVLKDQEAAEALLEAAEDMVRSEGMTAIRGPVNYSTNEECALLVDGWDGPPVVLMPYNPPYYQDFISGAGYAKVQDLYAYMVDLTRYKADGTGINPKVLRVTKKVKERMNITLHPINMRNFAAEAERFKEVYNAAWQKNWGFVPITEAEMEHQIMALKPILDPNIVHFAEMDGKTVGAALILPDVNQALIHAYPRPGTPEWWTMAKFLYQWKLRRRVTTMRAFAGGVIEEYRGRGVDAVMSLETVLAGIRHGYKKMEVSWVLESNIPMRQAVANFDGEHYRTYRIYEKAL